MSIDIEKVKEDGKELKYILENEKILRFKNYVDNTLLALEQQQAEITELQKRIDNKFIFCPYCGLKITDKKSEGK